MESRIAIAMRIFGSIDTLEIFVILSGFNVQSLTPAALYQSFVYIYLKKYIYQKL